MELELYRPMSDEDVINVMPVSSTRADPVCVRSCKVPVEAAKDSPLSREVWKKREELSSAASVSENGGKHCSVEEECVENRQTAKIADN